MFFLNGSHELKKVRHLFSGRAFRFFLILKIASVGIENWPSSPAEVFFCVLNFFPVYLGQGNDMSSSPQNTECAKHKEKPVTEVEILKVSKEVVVKFIEVRSLSPANFSETFREIHRSIRDAVRS